MKLAEYIARVGNKAAADLFGVEVGTAKAWRYGYRRPSADAALRIVSATGGEVSLEEALGVPASKQRAA